LFQNKSETLVLVFESLIRQKIEKQFIIFLTVLLYVHTP